MLHVGATSLPSPQHIARAECSLKVPSLARAQVAQLLSSPLGRAQETARTVADLQGLAGHVSDLEVVPLEELNNRDWGALEGRAAAEVRPADRACAAPLAGGTAAGGAACPQLGIWSFQCRHWRHRVTAPSQQTTGRSASAG